MEKYTVSAKIDMSEVEKSVENLNNEIQNARVQLVTEDESQFSYRFHELVDDNTSIGYQEAKFFVSGLIKIGTPVLNNEKDMIFYYAEDAYDGELYKVWIKVPELDIEAIYTEKGEKVFRKE